MASQSEAIGRLKEMGLFPTKVVEAAKEKEKPDKKAKAAETAARELGEKQQQVVRLEAENASAREQITAWEDAVKQRDERIEALDGQLVKTRAKLDEAVARLKESTAR